MASRQVSHIHSSKSLPEQVSGAVAMKQGVQMRLNGVMVLQDRLFMERHDLQEKSWGRPPRQCVGSV